MADYPNLPIFRDAYALTLAMYSVTESMPRASKYSLGLDMRRLSGELVDGIVMLNRLATDRSQLFEQAYLNLERLKIHIRLAYDVRSLDVKKYEQLATQCETVGRQLAGWQKWYNESARGRAGQNPPS